MATLALSAFDIALWDIRGKALDTSVARLLGGRRERVPAYASGGYYFPSHDIDRLTDEIRQFLDHGYTHIKIKIGGRSLAEDLRRIEAALSLLPGGDHLAVEVVFDREHETADSSRFELSDLLGGRDGLRPGGGPW